MLPPSCAAWRLKIGLGGSDMDPTDSTLAPLRMLAALGDELRDRLKEIIMAARDLNYAVCSGDDSQLLTMPLPNEEDIELTDDDRATIERATALLARLARKSGTKVVTLPTLRRVN